MLNIKKMFIWHLSGERWAKAYDKVYAISSSFQNTHQRFLDKFKGKRSRRPMGRKDSGKN